MFESGVIKNDAELGKLYKIVDTKYGQRKIFKSLTELRNYGIITASKDRLKHSIVGDWTQTHRLINGGHSQRGMDELLSTGVKPVIYKEYSNGVRIRSVLNHKNAKNKPATQKLIVISVNLGFQRIGMMMI